MSSAVSQPGVAPGPVPDVEYVVTITAMPLGPMAPETTNAVMALIEGTRRAAERVLVTGELGQCSLPLAVGDRLRIAIARWDELAKAEKRAVGTGVAADIAAERVARDAFEDAFNLVIGQFEKEFPRE